MRRMGIVVLAVVMMTTALLTGCSSGDSEPEPMFGTLEALQTSFSLDDAMSGEIGQVDFWGVVVVALEDGRRVDATVTNAQADVLKGGDRLEVVPVEDSEYWRVVGIASS